MEIVLSGKERYSGKVKYRKKGTLIMEEDIYLKKLAQRNIKPTAMRLLILRAMMQFDRAFSLLDWKHTWIQWINPHYHVPSTSF